MLALQYICIPIYMTQIMTSPHIYPEIIQGCDSPAQMLPCEPVIQLGGFPLWSWQIRHINSHITVEMVCLVTGPTENTDWGMLLLVAQFSAVIWGSLSHTTSPSGHLKIIPQYNIFYPKLTCWIADETLHSSPSWEMCFFGLIQYSWHTLLILLPEHPRSMWCTLLKCVAISLYVSSV